MTTEGTCENLFVGALVSMLSSLNALSAFGVKMYPTDPMPTLVRSAFLGT